jgi:hypothetical protein
MPFVNDPGSLRRHKADQITRIALICGAFRGWRVAPQQAFT